MVKSALDVHARYSSPVAGPPTGAVEADVGSADDGTLALPLWTLKCEREELQHLCLQFTELCTSFISKVAPFSAALHLQNSNAFPSPFL